MVIDAEGRIEVRPLLQRIAMTVLGLTLLGAAGGWWFADSAGPLADSFVDGWGGPGVALGFFMSDALAVPVPPDIFLALGYIGGMPVPMIIAWASAGSLIGGAVGFGLARLLARAPAVRRRLEARGAEVAVVLQRYGVLGLALGAMTPLPYSIMAWTSALLGMSWRTFLVVSLLRPVRVVLYLLLIMGGFVAVQ